VKNEYITNAIILDDINIDNSSDLENSLSDNEMIIDITYENNYIENKTNIVLISNESNLSHGFIQNNNSCKKNENNNIENETNIVLISNENNSYESNLSRECILNNISFNENNSTHEVNENNNLILNNSSHESNLSHECILNNKSCKKNNKTISNNKKKSVKLNERNIFKSHFYNISNYKLQRHIHPWNEIYSNAIKERSNS
jgi:hypothetical protein